MSDSQPSPGTDDSAKLVVLLWWSSWDCRHTSLMLVAGGMPRNQCGTHPSEDASRHDPAKTHPTLLPTCRFLKEGACRARWSTKDVRHYVEDLPAASKSAQQSHYLSLRYTVQGGRRFPKLLRCLLDLFFEDERFQLHRLANGLSAELQFQIKATLRV